MSFRYRRFYKSDEDSSFNEVKVEDCLVKELIELEPISDDGCWRQKSTGRLFVNGTRAAVFEDGTSNREDFEWITF